MIELIATAGGLIVGGGIFAGLPIARYYREEIRKLNNRIACRDRKIDEQERRIEMHKDWLDERDTKVDKQTKEINRLTAGWHAAGDELNAIKAKRSARIAAGNRTRRIKRLAAEAENARLEKKAEQAFARKTVKVIGSGVEAL